MGGGGLLFDSARGQLKTLDSVSVRNIVATLPYSSTARNDGPGIFRSHGIAARCARPIKDSGLRIQSGVAIERLRGKTNPRRHGRSPPRKRQPHPHRHAHGLPYRYARAPHSPRPQPVKRARLLPFRRQPESRVFRRFRDGSLKTLDSGSSPEWRLSPPVIKTAARLKPPFTVQQPRGVDAGSISGEVQAEGEVAGGFADGEGCALLIRGLALDVAAAGEAD